MTVPTGLSISGSPITSSGTLALGLASGYSIPTTANQTNWTTAYNDKINSLAVTGTTLKTITLTQQDGGTVSGTFTDNTNTFNSYALLAGRVTGRNIDVTLAGFTPVDYAKLQFIPDSDIPEGDTITVSVNGGTQFKVFETTSCVDTLAMELAFRNNMWFLLQRVGEESVTTNVNTGDQGLTISNDTIRISATDSIIDLKPYVNEVDTLFTTIAISDETTALTVGTAKRTFRMPYACTLTKVRASVVTAPTGATLIFDIKEGGTTVLSTLLSIDATEKTSKTATSAAVISDSSLADDAEMTIDITQVGSTVAGAGAKIVLYYVKN
jgi:hypothetical protein